MCPPPGDSTISYFFDLLLPAFRRKRAELHLEGCSGDCSASARCVNHKWTRRVYGYVQVHTQCTQAHILPNKHKLKNTHVYIYIYIRVRTSCNRLASSVSQNRSPGSKCTSFRLKARVCCVRKEKSKRPGLYLVIYIYNPTILRSRFNKMQKQNHTLASSDARL